MYALCFVLVMLFPVVMFVLGVKWRLSPPAFKSTGLVYRTEVTLRGEEVWFFAHTHCGKLWQRYGFILGALSALYMIFIDGYTKYLLWVLLAQMLVLTVTIFLIDMFTKNLFDENGMRIG